MATVGPVTGIEPRLHVDDVDLESLILARNDGHPDGDWWFDPETGQCLYFGLDDDSDLPALRRGVHVLIPHDPQPAIDIDDFIATVADEDAVHLHQAFHRRGGAKRFREVVARSAVAEDWTRFAMRREAVRAIDWLTERDLIEPASAILRRRTLSDDDE